MNDDSVGDDDNKKNTLSNKSTLNFWLFVRRFASEQHRWTHFTLQCRHCYFPSFVRSFARSKCAATLILLPLQMADVHRWCVRTFTWNVWQQKKTLCCRPSKRHRDVIKAMKMVICAWILSFHARVIEAINCTHHFNLHFSHFSNFILVTIRRWMFPESIEWRHIFRIFRAYLRRQHERKFKSEKFDEWLYTTTDARAPTFKPNNKANSIGA